MASQKTASVNEALGRIDFEMQADQEALTVHLDRQGFRRLLRTLEQLAETGGEQVLERSGRRKKGRNSKAQDGFPPRRLIFQMSDKLDS